MSLLDAVYSNILSSPELTAAAVSGWSLLLSLQAPGEVHRWGKIQIKLSKVVK